MARCRLAGLPSTGPAERSAEIGSGSTPRNGAESMATVTADRPRPARIWAIRPPNECQPTDDVGVVVGDLPDGLVGEDLRGGIGLGDGFGVVRPARRQRCVAGLLE